MSERVFERVRIKTLLITINISRSELLLYSSRLAVQGRSSCW